MKNYKLKKRRQSRHLFFVFMIKLLFQLVASLGLFLVLGLMLGGAAAAQELSWFDGNGPKTEAWQAIDVLSAAAEEGLDAGHYGAEPLRRAVPGADRSHGPTRDQL